MNPNTTIRSKKVYQLRKTISSLKNKQKQEINQKPDINQRQSKNQINSRNDLNLTNEQPSQILDNNSIFRKNQTIDENYTIEEESTRREVDGPELVINTLFLDFQEKLDCIQTRQIKVKNIGSSAVYYQWKFKNQPKINSYAIKDAKPKFFCHYSKNSIKPGEQITFIFTFVSEIPGFFTQECELLCQPAIHTKIPTIKLQGKAYIDDEWKQERANFLKQLENSAIFCSVSQTLDDLIDEVRLPEPPRPDTKDVKIAQSLFEKVNQNQNLYFNPYIHQWFNQLFEQIWKKESPQSQNQPYWDQSIQSFRNFITNAHNLDQVEKICYLQRLQHYTYLSSFPLPNKSLLYDTVKQIISEAVYHLGGDHLDAVRKQLDMWQVSFRQPLQTDTQDDLKTRKEQVDKIKAQWLKRTKKKKWGQEQDKQMIQQFKNKLRTRVNQQILDKFDSFENKAEFTKVKNIVENNNFDSNKYFLFLERLKTVKQSSLEGKKVLLKFNLKLKENCEKQLQQLNQYLVKRDEQKKKLQEQKKNPDAKKKKASKKKGQKQQQEQSPVSFDFSRILDQQNWKGFLQTFKIIQEKSPFLILIGCTYRERLGRVDPNLSIQFILEQLKAIQPSIEFMDNENLLNIRENLQIQNISEGSIFLLQNLNFLPSQTLVCQEVQIYEQQGVQKQKISKKNALYPQIRNNLEIWATCLDVIVDEDRFLTKPSGISSYSGLDVILGSTWWNYIGLICRVQNQYVVLGGQFNPQSYLLLCRILQYTKKVYLTGQIGLKFSLVKNNRKSLGQISLNQIEIGLIKNVLDNTNSQQLFIPSSFKLIKNVEGQQNKEIVSVNLSQLQQDNTSYSSDAYRVVDIVDEISPQISSLKGQLFMLGHSTIASYNEQKHKQLTSTVSILKTIFKLQQQKRSRHAIQINTPAGIDYQKDLVFYMIGISQQQIQKMQLKQKKVRIHQKNEDEQQEQQQENQPEVQESDQQKRKIDLLADFKLSDQNTIRRLLVGRFDTGLKNIAKYKKPLEI